MSVPGLRRSNLWIWSVVVLGLGFMVWRLLVDRPSDELFAVAPGSRCENLDSAQARKWLAAHADAQILDVRTAGEFAGGALTGAINLPVGDDDFDLQAARLDRARPLFLYCASGMRSRRALARLKALGFAEIGHLDGGLLSW
jgi:rhodanese-related sulfurtransferase